MGRAMEDDRMPPEASVEPDGMVDVALLPALDPAVERELRLPRLRRLISRRAREVMSLIPGDGAGLVALLELLETYRRRRELAYFRTGRARRPGG